LSFWGKTGPLPGEGKRDSMSRSRRCKIQEETRERNLTAIGPKSNKSINEEAKVALTEKQSYRRKNLSYSCHGGVTAQGS